MQKFYLACANGLRSQSAYSADEVRECVNSPYWGLTRSFFVPEKDTRIKHFRKIIHDPETCCKITAAKHIKEI